MQERLINIINTLSNKLPDQCVDNLLTYVKSSWTEITLRGQEYRLYNITQAMGTIEDTTNIKDLVDGIVSGADEMWAIAENYCYDYFVLNDMLLV